MSSFSNSDPYLAIERALRAARSRAPSNEGPRSRQMWDQYQADAEPYGNRPWSPTPYEPTIEDVEAVQEALGVDAETAVKIIQQSSSGGSAGIMNENYGRTLGLLQNHAEVLGRHFGNIGKDIGFGYRDTPQRTALTEPATPSPRADRTGLSIDPRDLANEEYEADRQQALQSFGRTMGEQQARNAYAPEFNAQLAAIEESQNALREDMGRMASMPAENARLGAIEQSQEAARAAMENQARLAAMFTQEAPLTAALGPLSAPAPAQPQFAEVDRLGMFANPNVNVELAPAYVAEETAPAFQGLQFSPVGPNIGIAEDPTAVAMAIAEAMAANEAAMSPSPGGLGYGSQNNAATAGYGYGTQNEAPDSVFSAPAPVAAVRGLTAEPNIGMPVTQADIDRAIAQAMAAEQAADVSTAEEGGMPTGATADAIDRALAVARLGNLAALEDMGVPSRDMGIEAARQAIAQAAAREAEEAGIPGPDMAAARAAMAAQAALSAQEFGVPGADFTGARQAAEAQAAMNANRELEAALAPATPQLLATIQDVSAARSRNSPLTGKVDTIVVHDEAPDTKQGKDSVAVDTTQGDNLGTYHITFDENGVYINVPLNRVAPHAAQFNSRSIGVARRGALYTEGTRTRDVGPQGKPDKVKPMTEQEAKNAAIALGLAMQATGLGPDAIKTHPQLGPAGTLSGRSVDEGHWLPQALKAYETYKPAIDQAISRDPAANKARDDFASRGKTGKESKEPPTRQDLEERFRSVLPPKADRRSSLDGIPGLGARGAILGDLNPFGVGAAQAAPMPQQQQSLPPTLPPLSLSMSPTQAQGLAFGQEGAPVGAQGGQGSSSSGQTQEGAQQSGGQASPSTSGGTQSAPTGSGLGGGAASGSQDGKSGGGLAAAVGPGTVGGPSTAASPSPSMAPSVSPGIGGLGGPAGGPTGPTAKGGLASSGLTTEGDRSVAGTGTQTAPSIATQVFSNPEDVDPNAPMGTITARDVEADPSKDNEEAAPPAPEFAPYVDPLEETMEQQLEQEMLDDFRQEKLDMEQDRFALSFAPMAANPFGPMSVTSLSNGTPPGMPAYGSFRAAQQEGLAEDESEDENGIENSSFNNAFSAPSSFGAISGFSSGLAGTSLGAASEGVTGSPPSTEGAFSGLGLGQSAVDTAQGQMNALGLQGLFDQGFANPLGYSSYGLDNPGSNASTDPEADGRTDGAPTGFGPSDLGSVDTSPSSQTDGPGSDTGSSDPSGGASASSAGDGTGGMNGGFDGTEGGTTSGEAGYGGWGGHDYGGGGFGPSGSDPDGGTWADGGYVSPSIERAIRAARRALDRDYASGGFVRVPDEVEFIQSLQPADALGRRFVMSDERLIDRALRAAQRYAPRHSIYPDGWPDARILH